MLSCVFYFYMQVIPSCTNSPVIERLSSSTREDSVSVRNQVLSLANSTQNLASSMVYGEPLIFSLPSNMLEAKKKESNCFVPPSFFFLLLLSHTLSLFDRFATTKPSMELEIVCLSVIGLRLPSRLWSSKLSPLGICMCNSSFFFFCFSFF